MSGSSSAIAVVATLSKDDARSLTDEVKHDAERLWRKLVELYDREAHLALGYSSWGSYFTAEFGGHASRGYQLLNAARIAEILDSTTVERPNEAQTRELAPLLKEPARMKAAWKEAVEATNGNPTALAVKETVSRRAMTDDDRQEIMELRKQGKKVAEISAIVGWSQSAVSKVTAKPKKPGRLPRRQQAGTDQTRALAKIHQSCRDWNEMGDEVYIPAPEIARRIRVLSDDIAFLAKKRSQYKEVAP